MRQRLFAHSGDVSHAIIDRLAKEVDLDRARLARDAEGVGPLNVIRDLLDADRLMLRSVPSFLLCTPDSRVFR